MPANNKLPLEALFGISRAKICWATNGLHCEKRHGQWSLTAGCSTVGSIVGNRASTVFSRSRLARIPELLFPRGPTALQYTCNTL